MYEWRDCHLHKFFGVNGNTFETYDIDDDLYGGDCAREMKPITDFFKNSPATVGKTLLAYEYDFGDSWELMMRVKKIEASAEFFSVPRNIVGYRKAPKEDSRGEVEHALRSQASFDKLLPHGYTIPVNRLTQEFRNILTFHVLPRGVCGQRPQHTPAITAKRNANPSAKVNS